MKNTPSPVRQILPILACAIFVTFLIPSPARAQGTKADYDRAGGLQQLTANKVTRDRVEPHWIDTSNTSTTSNGPARFWYRSNLGTERREFILVDPERAQPRLPAFDHTRLAQALTLATSHTFAADRLPLENLDFTTGGAILFNAALKTWCFDPKNGELKDVSAQKDLKPRPEATPAARSFRGSRTGGGRRGRPTRDGASPDGKWTAAFENNNLWLTSRETQQRFALSTDGTTSDAYSGYIAWSPDSKKIAVLRTKQGQEHKVYTVESSPANQLQPKLHSQDYLKPGDQIALRKPHLFDVAARREIPVKDTLFPNPWAVEELRWAPDSGRFTFFYNQRGHQVLRIIAVDAATGEARPIVDEQSKTFIDYNGKRFSQYLDASNEIIWMSERSGWNHLYLYDALAGKVKNAITSGTWVVRRVERVDEKKRQVWFWAGGLDPKQDPYYLHLCRVNLDGTGFTQLTHGDGTHTAVFSPDGRWIIDTYSRVDMPPVTELRRADDGQLVCELEKADGAALRATGWRPPERFVAKGRDGKTDIYGVIWLPMHFDPARKYPVIEYIYAGPQDSFVPKSFKPYYRQQSLAELGFIVVQCDGMGTSNRSKAFHDVCWKNLGDSGFPDRIPWIQAVAQKYPGLDLSRVGIYGTSAGAQSSLRALLTHGDFYKAAVSDSGCHDNRMDKIWWNELWMGWPVGPHYAEQSNVTQAHRLTGKLLLIVGELDTNVDPASTMQVVNALIKANKDFDLLAVPGGGHGIGNSPYGWRRTEDFFVRNLLGAEPRREK